MPSLVVFGRRWDIGSDDLDLPALVEAIATASWLGILGTVYVRNSHTVHFSEGSHVKYFYVGGILLSTMNLALLMGIAHYSLKGTVINTWPRRHMTKLLWVKMGFGVIALLYAIPSTKWTFVTPHPADDIETAPVATMRKAVIALWTAIGISTFFWRNAFHQLTQAFQMQIKKISKNFERDENLKTVAANTWTKRVQDLADMMHLHGHPEIQNVAKIVEELFHDQPVDTVATDTLAALILMDKDQERRFNLIQAASAADLTDMGGDDPNRPHLQPWMTVKNCAHYAKYAAAVYGWPYYVMESPVAVWGLLKVLVRSRMSEDLWFLPRKLPWNIIGDNSLLLNTTVFKIITGRTDEEIVYASYHNKLFEIPFVVSVDHAQQSVVVTIRGTLSLEDIFVDMVAVESEEIPIPGQKGIRVHQGMYRTAQYIQAQLLGLNDQGIKTNDGILDQAWDELTEMVGRERADEYHLVITGQSLGAGTAAILALLMQQLPKYHNLQCYAYSPPGGLMRLGACKYCEDFVCTVVLGDDIVGRLSMPSLYDFRVRLLKQLKHCDIPKHKIYGGWLQDLIGKMFGERVEPSEVEGKRPSWGDDAQAAAAVYKWQSEVEIAIEWNERKKEEWVKLYPPGCVIHISETPASRSFFRGTKYKYSYTVERGDCHQLSEVIISSKIVRHHTPYMVLRALVELSQASPSHSKMHSS